LENIMGQIKDNLPTNLRELRLWHYREALRCRAIAGGFETMARNHVYPKDIHLARAAEYHAEAVLHDSAVEVLDDVVDGPVEADYLNAKGA
jgi:hypothetical protein